MDEITIRYWSPHGRQEETKYRCSDEKIDLITRAAKKVDLTNLSKCINLVTLNLANNMLEELDLSPLVENTKLSELRLENNHLPSLNLWPLVNCMNLSKLDLTNNRIQSLDITPVLTRSKVLVDSSVVIYADNILRYMFTTKELGERFLLIRPDRVPWTAPPVLMWTTYQSLAMRMQWSELRERILTILDQISIDKWYHVQRGLLIGLGMEELGGYDGNPSKLLDTTDDSMSYQDARRAIFDRTVELLDEQISQGGPTLFLDAEAMRESRASKLIVKIVEARKHEIEKSVVLTKASISMLNSLWLTHYGHKILKALNIGMRHFGAGNKLKKSFEELGFSLKFEEVESLEDANTVDPIVASQSMKDFVFNQIENVYL
ncbi:MAG: hypothetical protein ACFFEK_08555 [Candidatus Thorarchaeota archaeon]